MTVPITSSIPWDRSIGLTDTTGNLVEAYRYNAYGQPLQVSTVGNPYMFTGRRFDSETGLYYYRARYYSPQLRRFIEPDPIGFEGGMNLYAYVGNDPVNLIDPYGLDSIGKINIGGRIYKFISGDHHGVNPPEMHVHDIETNNKIGVKTGNIYDHKGKAVIGRIKAKHLSRLRATLRGAGYLGAAITVVEVYNTMTAEDAEAFDNFLNWISVLPSDLQEEALQNALKTRPDLFEEIDCGNCN